MYILWALCPNMTWQKKIDANEHTSLSYLNVSDGGEKSFIKPTPGKNGGNFAEYFKRVRRMDEDRIVFPGGNKIYDKKIEETEVNTFPGMGIHARIWNENFIQFQSIL
jgi:hypothetical protein